MVFRQNQFSRRVKLEKSGEKVCRFLKSSPLFSSSYFCSFKKKNEFDDWFGFFPFHKTFRVLARGEIRRNVASNLRR